MSSLFSRIVGAELLALVLLVLLPPQIRAAEPLRLSVDDYLDKMPEWRPAMINQFNQDDIDYQIEADFSGLIAPGMPDVAIRMGEVFGRLMNYGDGLYGGQFVVFLIPVREPQPSKFVQCWAPEPIAGSRFTDAEMEQIGDGARERKSGELMVGNVPVAEVLRRMGADQEAGVETKELDAYSSHFDHGDLDRDGKHSKEEYIEKGVYMTPQVRAGIFGAADGNGDGVVTKAEYMLNRIITDEAKSIVQGMDDDKDGLVERVEFVSHATKLLSDPDLAKQLYAALDVNADGGLLIPEYLRVWGQWARAGQKPAEERIAARRAGLAKPVP